MLKADYAIYLGREGEERIVEFIAGDTFFAVLETTTQITKESVRDLLKTLQEKIIELSPTTLKDYKDILSQHFASLSSDVSYSVSSGLVVGDVLYTVTMGAGEVYLQRAREFARLIEGDNSASGIIQENDLFIFATKEFSLLADQATITQHLATVNPKHIVEELTPILKEKDDEGAISLFVTFIKDESAYEAQTVEVVPESEEILEQPNGRQARLNGISHIFSNFFNRLKQAQQQSSGNKKLTLFVVVVLFAVLVWSIILGYQRRENARLQTIVASYSERIEQKLTEAEDVSVLNLERSQILLNEAKSELDELKNQVGKKENTVVLDLEAKITKAEKKIVRTEDKKPEVFYDLALIEKGAMATSLYKDADEAVLLNSEKGKLYTLNLAKKAADTLTKKEVKGSSQAAVYNGEYFFIHPGRGIQKINKDGKVVEAVAKDDEWKTPKELWIYNGNLYLLDPGADEIYKYLVAESGYSSKSAYFKSGEGRDLAKDASMAIDSSVYIASSGRIFKYVTGVREDFSVTFPDKNPQIDKLFTDKNTAKLYALNKSAGKIYVMGKTGEYEKQIESSILKKADDFVVVDAKKSIIVLVDDKLYSLATE